MWGAGGGGMITPALQGSYHEASKCSLYLFLCIDADGDTDIIMVSW